MLYSVDHTNLIARLSTEVQGIMGAEGSRHAFA